MDSRPLPTEGPSAGGGDEFDDLMDYDAGLADEDDPFSENYKTQNQKLREKEAGQKGGEGAAGLGIDEEVEVTRKPRAPRVKLDENRLLSANGIPKLRNKAKKHLKFKGKGHEYSDAANLLGFYQLWLDDLFPKARFLDALAMVEKMGHKKRMVMMRNEWINEGKPHMSTRDDVFDEPRLPEPEREKTLAPIFDTAPMDRLQSPARDGVPDEAMDDLYDATPRVNRTSGVGGSLFGPAKNAANDEYPEDDLDALLAEAEANQAPTAKPATARPVILDEEDDLDALLAEEETLKAVSANAKTAPNSNAKAAAQSNSFEDEMEAMADMGMEW